MKDLGEYGPRFVWTKLGEAEMFGGRVVGRAFQSGTLLAETHEFLGDAHETLYVMHVSLQGESEVPSREAEVDALALVYPKADRRWLEFLAASKPKEIMAVRETATLYGPLLGWHVDLRICHGTHAALRLGELPKSISAFRMLSEQQEIATRIIRAGIVPEKGAP